MINRHCISDRRFEQEINVSFKYRDCLLLKIVICKYKDALNDLQKLSLPEPPHYKTNKVACVPSEDSDQPGHLPSLIRVFAVRMKKSQVLSYPLSAQRRLWSDWADAQADLSLCWAQSHFVGFLMRRLIYSTAVTRTRPGTENWTAPSSTQSDTPVLNEPHQEKTSLRSFRPGKTQTGLRSHRKQVEAWNFSYSK